MLDLIRIYESTDGSIIGRLYLDDEFMCYTLEPPLFRPLFPAIPFGKYEITLDVVSPKFCNRSPYRTLCKGCVPRLLHVPSREGILIHVGNTLADTTGCILVGDSWKDARLISSTSAFTRLYKALKRHKKPLYITIDDSDGLERVSQKYSELPFP